jgi:hypothetical protein
MVKARFREVLDFKLKGYEKPQETTREELVVEILRTNSNYRRHRLKVRFTQVLFLRMPQIKKGGTK